MKPGHRGKDSKDRKSEQDYQDRIATSGQPEKVSVHGSGEFKNKLMSDMVYF